MNLVPPYLAVTLIFIIFYCVAFTRNLCHVTKYQALVCNVSDGIEALRKLAHHAEFNGGSDH